MRNKFDEQLHNLNDEMIKMGKLCEQAIAAAIKMTMDHANEELKAEVLDTDAEIDRKERVIEKQGTPPGRRFRRSAPHRTRNHTCGP